MSLRVLMLGMVAILPACLLAGYSNTAHAAKSDESAARGAACDRACLQGFVDRYLDALVAHDPSRLPVAKSVKYTENTAQMPLGDGLWVGASERLTTFKIYALDPVAHQAGLMGVMKEFGKPVSGTPAESRGWTNYRDRAYRISRRAKDEHAQSGDSQAGIGGIGSSR